MKHTLKEIHDNDYAIHCDTEEKANLLCKAMDKKGWTWSGGTRCTEDNRWEHDKNNTCYRPSCGGYCNVDWYKNEGYTIVEFEDVILPRDSFIDSIFSNTKAGVVAVKFADGSKRVLHLQKGDKFDLEKAVALAIAEKQCGGYSKFKEEMENALKGGKK